MGGIRRKIECGERCWAAEIALRLCGLALLAGCVLASATVLRIVPTSEGSPLAFLVALVAFACLTGGLALAMFGPQLFRLLPPPPRALLP